MKKLHSINKYYKNNKLKLKEDTDFEKKNGIDPKFEKLIGGAAAGGVGAIACLKYLDYKYNINTPSSLNQQTTDYVKKSLSNIPGSGAFEPVDTTASGIDGLGGVGVADNSGGFFNSIKLAIYKAVGWVNGRVSVLTSKVPYLNKSIAGTSYTYGSIFTMALLASAITIIIYRLYKILRHKIRSTENINQYYARQKFAINKALSESVLLFDTLTYITEDEQLSIASKARVGMASIGGTPDEKYYGVTDDGRTISGTAKELFDGKGKESGFIDKMWNQLMNMWSNMKDWATKNKELAIVVAICMACIACWYGIRKYLKSKQNNDSIL